MTLLDAVVFVGLLLLILLYGMWKGRGQTDTDNYLRAGRSLPWTTVLLSVMATQASAITFLSAPGQAYTDGMRFVQYYFGLPLAMIVISAVFIPIFQRQNVYTAYEYLEQRFDRRTRTITSILFLLSRGISTGISIYAPSIIVSTLLDWNIYATNVLVGGLLILYTWRGGARAVAHTQTIMFGIIIASMAASVYFLLRHLPPDITFLDSVMIAGKSGALNVITTDFDLNDKYNLFSGLVGGFFLALSYFGTDQSQVGRFITGKGVEESRKGMLMNGIVKVPMQFSILFIGALLVALYTVMPAPVFFNPKVVEQVRTEVPAEAQQIEDRWEESQERLSTAARAMIATDDADAFTSAVAEKKAIRADYQQLVRSRNIAESNDANYVFLHFVRTALPAGMVGLIFAIIIMASWGSISAAIHALGTASYVDLRSTVPGSRFQVPRTHTLFWGLFGIAISMAATRMGSLIEAVNVLGSLFYGPILGIFLVAFFVKKAGGRAVFYGAIAAEVIVFLCWSFDVVSFLWLNVVGSGVVVLWALLSSVRPSISRTTIILAVMMVLPEIVLSQPPWTLIQRGQYDTVVPLREVIHAVPWNSKGTDMQDVLKMPDSAFVGVEAATRIHSAEGVARLTFVNTSDAVIQNMVSTCEGPDSVDYYRREGNRLVRFALSGTRRPRHERDMPDLFNFVQVQVPPHDSVEVFMHLRFSGGGKWGHIHHTFMREMKSGFGDILSSFTIQAFYGGIMTVFSIIALLMFFSFREWVFVTYAMMMLALNVYFMYLSGIMRAYLLPVDFPAFMMGNQWIIAAIVLFCSLFIDQYIVMKRFMPVYRKIYLTFSMYLAAFAFIWGMFLSERFGYLNLLNYQLLPWLALSFYPITRLSIKKERSALVLLISVALITIGATFNVLSLTNILPIKDNANLPFQLGSLAFSGTLFYGLFSKIKQIQNERTLLQVEKARADAVLFNVLPEAIAIELKETGESPARYLERVTVLFTDFKDFTAISTEMTPQELVAELNTLFSTFDTIIRRYGLEKIKTIGDAYMAAGGLRVSDAHEADVVVRAALEMQAIVEQRSQERRAQGLPGLTMRAGVHTGSVVAGVVGFEKFQYDLWGDTVNVASRMESSGVVGEVNISDATHTLLRDHADFTFTSRGTVVVKGKGAVPMWIARGT